MLTDGGIEMDTFLEDQLGNLVVNYPLLSGLGSVLLALILCRGFFAIRQKNNTGKN
jgi:hypothetical protein